MSIILNISRKFPSPLLIVIVVIGILSFVVGIGEYKKNSETRAQKVLNSGGLHIRDFVNSDGNVAAVLELQMLSIIDEHGLENSIELVLAAEESTYITNDQCHYLFHLIGHEAYVLHQNDFESILDVSTGRCLNGYIHGVEAQITLSNPDLINELESFCIYAKKEGLIVGPCFHGAGHAAMDLLDYDIFKSLELCNALYDRPETDITNCYRGVFSETSNLALGFDGHTGYSVESTDFEGLDLEDPYPFCKQFDERYKSSCITQVLSKIYGWRTTNIDESLSKCTNSFYPADVQETCVAIVHGMFTRRELSSKDHVVVSSMVQTFPKNLKEVAILGVLESYTEFLSNDFDKDWNLFCKSFNAAEDISYCADIFEDSIKNKTVPWIERTGRIMNKEPVTSQ